MSLWKSSDERYLSLSLQFLHNAHLSNNSFCILRNGKYWFSKNNTLNQHAAPPESAGKVKNSTTSRLMAPLRGWEEWHTRVNIQARCCYDSHFGDKSRLRSRCSDAQITIAAVFIFAFIVRIMDTAVHNEVAKYASGWNRARMSTALFRRRSRFYTGIHSADHQGLSIDNQRLMCSSRLPPDCHSLWRSSRKIADYQLHFSRHIIWTLRPLLLFIRRLVTNSLTTGAVLEALGLLMWSELKV